MVVTRGWVSGSRSIFGSELSEKNSTRIPPEFHRNSTPPPSGMVFWDDLELPEHRWFAQLPKLGHGRRFELAPRIKIGTSARRPADR